MIKKNIGADVCDIGITMNKFHIITLPLLTGRLSLVVSNQPLATNLWQATAHH
jgi:hypothetical protein